MPEAEAVHDKAIVVDVVVPVVTPVGAEGATAVVVALAMADVLEPAELVVIT